MKIFLILLFIIGSLSASAQFEKGQSCELSNPDLITQLHNGTITGLVLSSSSSYGAMASSTLAPVGKFPYEEKPSADMTEDDQDIEEIQYVNDSQDWMCQYSAHNVHDADPSTAWVEGVEGDGVGEVVMSEDIDITKPVKIWAGYGKSMALFKANNRPARVKVYVLASNCSQASVMSVHYKPFKVVGEKEIVLNDFFGFQNIELPVIEKQIQIEPCESDDERGIFYFIALEIRSVYRGTKYRDTCISEMHN